MPNPSDGGRPRGGGTPRSGAARGGTPRTGKPRTDQPRSGTPRGGGPRADQPRSGTPRAGGSRADQPRSDGPRSSRPRPDQARSDAPRAGRPRPDQPRSDAPRSSRPRPDQPRSDAPRSDAPRAGRPRSDQSRPDGPRSDAPRSSRPRTDQPRSDGPRSGAPRAGAPRTGAPRSGPPRTGAPRSGGARPPAARPARVERPPRPTGPALPPDVDPRDLPGDVRRELRGIPDPTVEKIASHLVAAGLLIDEDPAAAYEHAKFAKTLSPRVGAIREAVGVTAYHAGDYATALTELKAARRITGVPDQIPLLADCERAAGHPEKALAYADDPDRSRLDRAAQVELLIVLSGARRDLGQPDAAVVLLQGPELDSDAVEEWTPRLWYAYADALLAAGRTEDALHWFTAVATIDEDGETDAEERLAELSRR